MWLLRIAIALSLLLSSSANADEEAKKKHRASSHHQSRTASTPVNQSAEEAHLDAHAIKARKWKKVHENQTLEKATAQCAKMEQKSMAQHLYLFDKGVKTPVAKLGIGDIVELLYVMEHLHNCLRPKNRFGIRRWFDEPTIAVFSQEDVPDPLASGEVAPAAR